MDVVKLLKSAQGNREFETRACLTTPWSTREEDRVVVSPQTSASDVLNSQFPNKNNERMPATELPALHPHPQFARGSYTLLNGWWDYCLIDVGSQEAAAQSWRTAFISPTFNRKILVPFSPEAALSGICESVLPQHLICYRRAFSLDQAALSAGYRAVLHFEAVDWACSVFVDGTKVGEHQGAYLPFCFDITDALIDTSTQHQISLCVFDPSDSGSQLRGKQVLQPHGMWYTAQSGIWQSVWLEVVPADRIAGLRINAQLDNEQIELTVLLAGSPSELGDRRSDVSVAVELNGAPVASASVKSTKASPLSNDESSLGNLLDPAPIDTLNALTILIPLHDPLPWSPQNPQLYTISIAYGNDTIHSYCAFRTVSIEPDEQGVPRFCLNHQPLFLKGVLDQGYWPDGLMTAPAPDALAFDIATVQAGDFNMMRKHIKIESDLWYHFCDVAGMLVWQDIPSGGLGWNETAVCNIPTVFASQWTLSDGKKNHERFNAGDERYRQEWHDTCLGALGYLGNHPCIVTWVLFNEGWGQFDSAHIVEDVRRLDPTRTIDAASGWFDQGAGDFISEHNYFRSLKLRPWRFKKNPSRAYVISEFGGAVLPVAGHTSCTNEYGYGSAQSVEEWRANLDELRKRAASLEAHGLSGYVLTQLSDVEEETNGLITYDRKVMKYR